MGGKPLTKLIFSSIRIDTVWFLKTLTMELNEFQKAFGAKLSEALKMRGMSIYKLAKLTGISDSHLGRIARGEENCCIDSIRRISLALEIEPAFLFSWK
jgi:predicted transcriptional regulator